MKIVCQKKSLLAYLEVISVPKKSTEPVVTIEARQNHQVAVSVTHPDFTFTFLGNETEVEVAGTVSVTLSSIKKALSQTKAKFPVIIEDARVIQNDGTSDVEIPLEAADYIPRLPSVSLTNVEVAGEKLAPLLTPLTLFAQKDELHPWRNEVVLDKRAEGMQFTQCNGVHLASTLLTGMFPPSSLQRGVISQAVFEVFVKTMAFFPKAKYGEDGDIIGFHESPDKELLVRIAPTSAPTFAVPTATTYAQFHLNPIAKTGKKKGKPFEAVLLERMRAYRDERVLEYPDINLSFRTEPSDDGGAVIHATLSERGMKDCREILSTTSPFLAGKLPIIDLPGYDVIKALGSLPEITSLKLTDRGLLLETVQFDDGVRQATVFLNGRVRKTAVPA